MTEGEIFRRNLMQAMKDRGMTAAGLSKAAGLNARAVKDIEEGRVSSPRLSTVFALAEALGLDPGEMLGLGPRDKIQRELARYLSQFDESEQERLFAALKLLKPRE